jgi:NADPH:quinone reductase-like Zn-dependent oxidoreductase
VKALVADRPGPPEVLRWTDVPEPTLGPGQLLLRVRATSVNRADVLQRLGRYPPPKGVTEVPGLEAAGEVLALGPGVTAFREGDLAMALLAGGGHAERVAVDARHCLRVPASVGLPAAGGLMEVFVTAWLNLVEVGRLVAGERLLVHGGAGGVGTAALQVARLLGARVWATARKEKLDRVRALGAIAIDHEAEEFGGAGKGSRDDPSALARSHPVTPAAAPKSQGADFVATLRAAGGADLVLDVMGAKYLARNLEALADDGRLVVIGLQGGLAAELSLGLLLARRLTVSGSTLRALSADRKAAVIARAGARLLPAFDAGELRVIVDRVMTIERAGEAHALVESYGNVGKVLLEVP